MAGLIRREVFKASGRLSLENVERNGLAIIERAEARAADVLREARAAAEIEFEQGRSAGHDAGYAEGRAAGLASLDEQTKREALDAVRGKLTALTDTLASCLARFNADKRNLLTRAESGVIDLAYAIACRVCKALPALSSDSARGNARHVLDMARHEHDIRLHVHPDDLESLREYAAECVGRIDELEHVEVEADAAVERGGCVLHARDGTIDASIDKQLQRIAECILHDAGYGHEKDESDATDDTHRRGEKAP